CASRRRALESRTHSQGTPGREETLPALAPRRRPASLGVTCSVTARTTSDHATSPRKLDPANRASALHNVRWRPRVAGRAARRYRRGSMSDLTNRDLIFCPACTRDGRTTVLRLASVGFLSRLRAVSFDCPACGHVTAVSIRKGAFKLPEPGTCWNC